MASKQFNSVDGYSVGNASIVIDSNGNVSGNAITAIANVTAPRFISNVATGTAPLVVTSTTQVANLNVATAGTVTTAAQPNITSTGTLTSLTVSGNTFLATSGGNVTVGTTTPLLTAAGRGSLTVNGSTDSIVTFGVAGSYSAYLYSSATKLELDVQGARPIQFNTNGAERMRIDASGNVLINRTGASGYGKLNVEGGADFTGGNVLLCRDSGNVGIGTATPAAKLDVVGNTRIQSNIAYVSPNGANTINSTMLNGGTLAWSGNAGQLFSITDSMTGNIFAVNDVSGIPMISVDAGGNIQMAAAGGFVSYGVTAGITAAGSTQGTATALTRPINVVSTVSASTGVILPTVPAGARIIVMNTSGTALNVYPPTSAAINSAATNAAYSMPAGTRLEFISVSATQWYTMNATYG